MRCLRFRIIFKFPSASRISDPRSVRAGNDLQGADLAGHHAPFSHTSLRPHKLGAIRFASFAVQYHLDINPRRAKFRDSSGDFARLDLGLS